MSAPRSHQRNEGKILSFNWDVLSHEITYSRKGAKNLQKESAFVRAISDLRRQNRISDNSALEETLENIVGTWPQVMYLTQEELAQTIALALEAGGIRNYDDQQCGFHG